VRRVFPTEKPRGSPLGKKAKWNDLGSWSVFVKKLIFFKKSPKKHQRNKRAQKRALE
jgi:hypothetical protein